MDVLQFVYDLGNETEFAPAYLNSTFPAAIVQMTCTYGPPVFGLTCLQDLEAHAFAEFSASASDLAGSRARARRGTPSGNLRIAEFYVLHVPAQTGAPASVVKGSLVVDAFYNTPPALAQSAFRYTVLEARTRGQGAAGQAAPRATTRRPNATVRPPWTLAPGSSSTTVAADQAESGGGSGVRAELVLSSVAVFLVLLVVVAVVVNIRRTSGQLQEKAAHASQGTHSDFDLVTSTLGGDARRSPGPTAAYAYGMANGTELAGQQQRWSAPDDDWNLDSITNIVLANAGKSTQQRLATNNAYTALPGSAKKAQRVTRVPAGQQAPAARPSAGNVAAGGGPKKSDWDIVGEVLQQSQELDARMVAGPHGDGNEWAAVLGVLDGGGGGGGRAPPPAQPHGGAPPVVTIHEDGFIDEEDEELRMLSEEPRHDGGAGDGGDTAGRATAWSQADRPPTAWTGVCVVDFCASFSPRRPCKPICRLSICVSACTSVHPSIYLCVYLSLSPLAPRAFVPAPPPPLSLSLALSRPLSRALSLSLPRPVARSLSLCHPALPLRPPTHLTTRRHCSAAPYLRHFHPSFVCARSGRQRLQRRVRRLPCRRRRRRRRR